jgi:hypothetical protein
MRLPSIEGPGTPLSPDAHAFGSGSGSDDDDDDDDDDGCVGGGVAREARGGLVLASDGGSSTEAEGSAGCLSPFCNDGEWRSGSPACASDAASAGGGATPSPLFSNPLFSHHDGRRLSRAGAAAAENGWRGGGGGGALGTPS